MAAVLPFSISLVLAVFVAAGIFLSQRWPWAAFAGWAFVFVVHPLLDLAFGEEEPGRGVRPPESMHAAFSCLPWLYVPLQCALLVGYLAWPGRPADYSVAWWGAVLSTGALTGAIGITVAHELVHRGRAWERALGVLLLSTVGYAHFRVEHVLGHHRHVGTPLDAATARRGESVYAFWVRSLWNGFRSAWHIEATRLAGRPFLAQFVGNRVARYVVLQLALLAAAWLTFGTSGAAFLVGQAVVAVLLLETVNYLEHYGLERRELAPGRYEPVRDDHSWDSRHRMTNWILFNLGKHAHHHRNPSLPYERLENAKAGPVLPFGYSLMLWLALVPPWWRRRMG
jgi:alkane 1-monooxygenase